MGKFISFEGIEGSGKSTQAKLLAHALSDRGIRCIVTREPGGTPLGERIREIVLRSELSPMAELFLYLAVRAEHIKEIIIPSLRDGIWVISDRYSDATVAYQGYGRGLSIDKILELNRIATSGIIPHITFLLDVPAEIGIQRAMSRISKTGMEPDRFERESLEFHRRVRNGYLMLAEMEPGRIKVIDGVDDKEKIHSLVMSYLEPLLIDKDA